MPVCVYTYMYSVVYIVLASIMLPHACSVGVVAGDCVSVGMCVWTGCVGLSNVRQTGNNCLKI